MTKTMEDIREGVINRIVNLCAARDHINDSLVANSYANTIVHGVWKDWGQTDSSTDYFVNNKCGGFTALRFFIKRELELLTNDIMAATDQFASLFVRDVIKPMLENTDEPIVALTGNSYVPALRSFDDIERIWQADAEGDVFERLIETFEYKCNELCVQLIYPEHDNCILGVGTNWYCTPDPEDSEDFYNPDNWTKRKN